jgi:hypothetical protein
VAFVIAWDDDDDPSGNVQHISRHGLGKGDVERILRNRRNPIDRSLASGRSLTRGWTKDGRYVAVVWDEVDQDPRTIYPVTAFEVPPLRHRRQP